MLRDLNRQVAVSEQSRSSNGDDGEQGLNRNAHEFIPNNCCRHKVSKKPKFKTIDEKQTFPVRASPYHICQSSYDPMRQCRAKYQIYISRECTAKITDEIWETFNDVYVFIDKSLSLHTGQSMFNNGTLWVINYGFHEKQSYELLYCVAVPTYGGSRKWSMVQKVFTTQEMKTVYHIKCASLPKTIRSLQFHTDIVTKNRIITRMLSEPEQIQSIVQFTPWHKVAIFNRNDNKKRIILKLNKHECIKDLNMMMTHRDEVIKLIPILMFDTENGAHHIEYVWIIRIEKGIDIGISFILNTENDELMVSGIHLNKTFLLNQHHLAIPQCPSCNCLDSFVSHITHLRIGNPDDDLNRIKDLTKKFKQVTQQLKTMQQELKDTQAENERLKQMMERYHNNNNTRTLISHPYSSNNDQ
eukprot:746639_1